MKKIINFEYVNQSTFLLKWLMFATIVALLAGSTSALFLIGLDSATQLRDTHKWMIWLLPFAGFSVGLVYHLYGKSVDGGNNRLIDEIHDPQQVIPLRMAPLVLGGTLISHLFGASVGREGTAVQMGGTLADQVSYLFRLQHQDRAILLMAGISAGFASVFGTPLAGAIFGLEVLAIGQVRYDALIPCLIASIIADQVCKAWGVHHTAYIIREMAPIGVYSVGAIIAAGILFGLVGRLFSTLTQMLGGWVKQHIRWAPLRPFVGGIVVAALIGMPGLWQFAGLGVPEIVRAFNEPVGLSLSTGKLAMTVLSLGFGFKGGEVTPLFYIGATFGNALAPLLHMPFSMMAGIGFVAVFAGAVNTPVATTLMAIELFGADIGPLAAVGCFTAFLFSGHTGIYHAQRVGTGKYFSRQRPLYAQLRISELAARRKQLRKRLSALALLRK